MARLAVLLLALGISFTSLSSVGASNDTQPDAWRQSWPAFAREVEAFGRSTSSTIPRARRDAIWTGLRVADATEVMQRFGGPVTFKAVFKSLEFEDQQAGSTTKVVLDLPRPRFQWHLNAYAKPAALPEWTGVAKWTPITFRARVTGVARMPIDGVFSETGFVLRLEDAEIVR